MGERGGSLGLKTPGIHRKDSGSMPDAHLPGALRLMPRDEGAGTDRCFECDPDPLDCGDGWLRASAVARLGALDRAGPRRDRDGTQCLGDIGAGDRVAGWAAADHLHDDGGAVGLDQSPRGGCLSLSRNRFRRGRRRERELAGVRER